MVDAPSYLWIYKIRHTSNIASKHFHNDEYTKTRQGKFKQATIQRSTKLLKQQKERYLTKLYDNMVIWPNSTKKSEDISSGLK